MNNIIERSFGRNLRLLKAMNLYSCKSKIRKCITYILMMLHVPIFGLLYFFLEQDVDMQRIGDNAPVVTEMVCYIFKLFPFITNEKRIKKCIYFLENVNYIECSKKQVRFVEEWIKSSKRNTVIFLTFFIGGVTSWALRPVFTRQHKLPVDVWLPFDPVEFDLVFYTIYFYLYIGALYPATASGAIEPMVAGLFSLATCHLKILKDNLQFLDEHCKDEQTNRIDRVKLCIKHHDAILQFAKEVEECFSQVVFSQLVGSVFVICFSCFRLSMLEQHVLDFISDVGILMALIVQIYFYCLYGTILFEESNSLTYAIYMGNWYDYDISLRKSLIVMMERSKKPVIITVGKILDVSLVTFTEIIKKSYSLLAVLNSQR